MKKKISLILCMLAAMLCFTGCSASKTEMQFDKAGIEQVVEFLINYCVESDADTLEQWENMTDFAMNQQLTEAGLPFTPESFRGALASWQTGVEECGSYLEHGNYTYDVSAKEIKVYTQAKFEDREAELEFIFDKKMIMESMTVSAEYTTGEILKKAGLNTLLGMGTVFAVLIFISAIISLFRFIPALEASLSGKSKKQETLPETVAAPVVAEEIDLAGQDALEGDELVAVIAAAIAAAEGTTVEGYQVRSIRRRKSNKWNA